MNNYNLKFDMNRIQCDKLPQNLVTIFTNTVGSSRVSEFMKFNSYGIISFTEDDEVLHKSPMFEEQDKYNRIKTNGILYDLVECTNNPKIYDKCLIYHSIGSKIGNWGFVMFNSENGEQIHKYFIEDNISDIVSALYNTIMSCAKSRELKKRISSEIEDKKNHNSSNKSLLFY